jgi:paraquat-inducible protein B
MAKKTNPALIGAFVVGSIALTVFAIVIWGTSELFERKYEYVCYFPGSVNGLKQGSSVKYRGVEVGVVKDIKVRFRQAPDDKRIPVFIELWGKRLQELGGREPNPQLMQELVREGLRVRLSSVNIVTGVMNVNLDEVPEIPPVFVELPGRGAIPELPTMPTEREEVLKAVSVLLANLSAVDFKGMANDFKGMADAVSEAMHGVNHVASSRDLRVALKELPPLLVGAQELTSSLKVDADRTGDVIDDVSDALGALVQTLDSAKGAISPHAPLSVDVTAALSDVDKAAVAVRELADFLRRNPHAIVAGTKPRETHR